MDTDEIAKLGDNAYARTLTAIRKDRVARSVVAGFDTEYDSKTGELISVQLSHCGNTLFWPTRELTPESLYDQVTRLLGTREKTIELASYFSLAELSHLPVWTQGIEYREYSGSFECTFKIGKAKLRVYDVARWYVGNPLSEAAKTVGLEKLKWKRSEVTPDDVSKPGFREYAVNDAIIAETLLNRLRDHWLESGIDILIYRTPAGASAAAFRRTLAADVVAPPTRARAVALAGVWGGRAEAFARGRFAQVYEYDLTSAYPMALSVLQRVPSTADWRCTTHIAECLNYNGYATGTFSYNRDCVVPTLPVFHAGSLLYPLAGKSTCTLSEWRLAITSGAEVDIAECWYYVDGSDELCLWMADILTRRKRSVGLMSYVLKLQANALVGKLAQRIHRASLETLRKYSEEEDIPLSLLASLSSEEHHLLGITEEANPGGAWWPEVNGLVTGAVRARIGSLAIEHLPVYVATDSLWTRRALTRLPADLTLKRSGPGEVWRTRVARIMGCGPGATDERPDLADHVVYHAWASRKAAWGAMFGGTRDYTVRRPIKPRESLRRNKKLGSWVEDERTGSLGWCGKRRLLPDGSSAPWKNTVEYDQWQLTERRDARSLSRRENSGSSRRSGRAKR